MKTITDLLSEESEDWTTSILLTPDFNNDSGVPKFKTLAFAIAAAMQNGQMKKGDLMPSVADYAALNKISTTTVIKAYRLLKNQGLIEKGKSARYWVTGKTSLGLLKN